MLQKDYEHQREMEFAIMKSYYLDGESDGESDELWIIWNGMSRCRKIGYKSLRSSNYTPSGPDDFRYSKCIWMNNNQVHCGQLTVKDHRWKETSEFPFQAFAVTKRLIMARSGGLKCQNGYSSWSLITIRPVSLKWSTRKKSYVLPYRSGGARKKTKCSSPCWLVYGEQSSGGDQNNFRYQEHKIFSLRAYVINWRSETQNISMNRPDSHRPPVDYENFRSWHRFTHKTLSKSSRWSLTELIL